VTAVDRDAITRKVKECIVEAVGVRLDEVALQSQVVNDLGADSLDLVELMFQLETAFGISLQRGAVIERIRRALPEEELVDDAGYITPRGRDIIRREVPELASVQFPEKLSFHMLLSYFTVEVFVNLVVRALEMNQLPAGGAA
jgi:acyl carrier protein